MSKRTNLAIAPLEESGVDASALQDLGKKKYDIEEITFDENCAAVVPFEDPLYVPFGNYQDVATITDSGDFFPYWIFGLSGNGKTLSIEQAHARLKKKLIVVPITREADEDSLLGGLRMINGSTKPFLGPVTIGAMLGCTVCLDETDLGDEKLMCLQTALQNRPFLIKRLGKVIIPQPGFNICATANTKGQGSDDGKFIGTNIMNEAMLDRYITVFEQDYPDEETERQILYKVLDMYNIRGPKEEHFVSRLLLWGKKVRETYAVEGISEVITTRRLVHIIRSYKMFGKNRLTALNRGISRFGLDTKAALLEFYTAIDASATTREEEEERVRKALETGKDPETGF